MGTATMFQIGSTSPETSRAERVTLLLRRSASVQGEEQRARACQRQQEEARHRDCSPRVHQRLLGDAKQA